MNRPTLDELRERCPKPGASHLGNWMARRVARPMALHITRVIIPWGITAHAVTLMATLVAVASAIAFGFGSIFGCLLGVGLLQLWYLLDHVDGQLARYHGTASLDGVQLDYLMHHLVNVIVPVGIGWGLFMNHGQPLWGLVGFVWGLALLTIGLWHDCRYKAFVQRLKWVCGELHVSGGGGSVPTQDTAIPTSTVKLFVWLLRKSCEIHIVMNLLSAVAVVAWCLADTRLNSVAATVALLCSAALLVAIGSIMNSLKQQASEQEFAAWYRVPEHHTILPHDGWWCVEPNQPQHEKQTTKAAG